MRTRVPLLIASVFFGGFGAACAPEVDEVRTSGAEPTVSDAPQWVNADGSVDLAKVPESIPVQLCAPPTGKCLGFVDARFIYPELQPADAPINSELGYQPGPSPVTDTEGKLVAYLVPDVGVVSVNDFDPSRHGTPEEVYEG